MGKKNKDGKKGKSGKKKDSAEIALGELGPAIVQAARTMRTVLSRNLLDSGLYAGQDGVVLALAETDGLTAGQLAQKLGVKAPTMTRTIGRMEAQGFLVRRADHDDARLTKVFLTEMGRECVAEISRSVARCDELAVHGLSDKEVRTLIKLLKSVDANLHATGMPDE
ncbi:MarR family transcriptional regulator [Rhizobiaceae bacterium n13]|uniref:MarR family transcriptional regulator n=1 Tax=Ferirhizobium litorale TaxID=2927786 RepID=A0AAE3U241_9HYPH|nr:MarR family transcriptional regulator [Fererhizobium litorale]MDI7860459.1 MarR family transcriptional regulator [Fererhizobium litorale]MDI7920594.1 MarR family transcriptional regulator [Fererhizobium litorale]